MNADEARNTAELMLETVEKHGYHYVFLESRRRLSCQSEWAVIFEVKSPDGSIEDGPVVVVVKDDTGAAHFL